MSDKYFTIENPVSLGKSTWHETSIFFQTVAQRKQNQSKPLDRSHSAKAGMALFCWWWVSTRQLGSETCLSDKSHEMNDKLFVPHKKRLFVQVD